MNHDSIDRLLAIIILVLIAWATLFVSGCAFSYSKKDGVAVRFEPTIRDFKAIKEISR